MRKYEKEFLKNNHKIICGVDEAGRGPWAGPLVAAACILDNDYNNPLINDSKKISKQKREMLFKEITKNAIDYSIVFIEVEEVDKIGPKKASQKAMIQAINNLKTKPEIALIDFEKLVIDGIFCLDIVRGDEKSISIAAASILAKVARDEYMKKIDKEYPQYNFKKNNGYGTKEHVLALQKNGICLEHRKSYKPIKKIIDAT